MKGREIDLYLLVLEKLRPCAVPALAGVDHSAISLRGLSANGEDAPADVAVERLVGGPSTFMDPAEERGPGDRAAEHHWRMMSA